MFEFIIKTLEHDDKGWLFEVKVVEKYGVGEAQKVTESVHKVELKRDDYNRLTQAKLPPKEFVKKCFNYLLDKESKDSILKEFNLMQIGDYFPNFEQDIRV